MWEKLSHLFKVPELRKRILFTLGAIIIFRLGTHIPVPGVDSASLKDFFATQRGGIFDFLNMFTGGALQRFSLFALGVTPYINASIIFSLLTAVIPKLKELQQPCDCPGCGNEYAYHKLGACYSWDVVLPHFYCFIDHRDYLLDVAW
jgi:preprotein translocase subunit SecY